MKGPMLFVPIRECVCCGRSAPLKSRRRDAGPAVMGLDMGIYRPALHVKARRRAAGTVGICEDCFAAVMASGRRFWQGERTARFLSAIKNAWARCYNDLLSEDRDAA